MEIVALAAAGTLTLLNNRRIERIRQHGEEQKKQCYAASAASTHLPPGFTLDSDAACDKRYHKDLWAIGDSPWFWLGHFAWVIGTLGVLPWAWYFLLRRIAELRAAIGGKPPES